MSSTAVTTLPLTEPTLSVIVPAHNESATIRKCLMEIIAQDYPIAEIIVVADACTDDTAAIAQSEADVAQRWRVDGPLDSHRRNRNWSTPIRVVQTNHRDKGAAQNEVLFDVATDLITGFDGDSWPMPGCIRTMVEYMQKWQLDATCSTILPAQGVDWPYAHDGGLPLFWAKFFTGGRRFAYALGRRWWRLCQSEVGRVQVLTGACYTFRTEAIQGIGGFPNTLATSDMDATWRLYAAGKRCGYAGDALALTIDPEDYRTYRAQMRRWSSGYFQCVALHRRQLLNWRSALVVGCGLLDMVMLGLFEIAMVLAVIFGVHHSIGLLELFGFWTAVHLTVTTAMVASVTGWRKALAGAIPYLLINYLNKFWYDCALVREWVLGRQYTSWTGRQGRPVEITPMTAARRAGLAKIGLGAEVATGAAAVATGASALLIATIVLGVLTVLVGVLPFGNGRKH